MRDNLLLITLDTTRADALGCYGGKRPRTPHLDRVAREGLVVERALCTAPVTLPSHTTMMTGLLPLEHGVRDNGIFRAEDSLDLLAEILKRQGYATAAFISANVLSRRYGLAQGFDTFDERLGAVGGGTHVERRASATVNAVLEWLANAPPEPFFVWVHFFDPHRPLRAPPEFVEQTGDSYAAEVTYLDHHLGRLLQRFRAENRLQRTLLVVAGDHGEGLGQHRELTHGLFLYDSTMHVPLLVRHHTIAPGRVGGQQSLVDLAPTLLDILQVPVPEVMSGRSRRREWQGETAGVDAPVHLESYLPLYTFGIQPIEAVSDGRFKYIHVPQPELYDLSSDPDEKHNLFQERPAEVKRLQALLHEFTGERDASRAMPNLDLDAEERERLEALGYVQVEGEAGVGQDPKDMIALMNRRVRAQDAIEAGRAEEAERELREVLALCPRDAGAWSILASALFLQGREAEAVAALERCLSLRPDQVGAAMDLARAHRRAGDLEAASQAYEHLIRIAPSHFQGRLEAAAIYQELGKPARAREQLEAARSLVKDGSRKAREVEQSLAELAAGGSP